MGHRKVKYALTEYFFLLSNELTSGCWWCFFELPPPTRLLLVVIVVTQINQIKSVGEPELETTINWRTQVQRLLHQTTSSAPEALAPAPVSLALI